MPCSSCNQNNDNVTPRINLPTFYHGIVGIAKATLGIDRATEEVIKSRRDECRNCEFSTKSKDKINNPSKGLTNRSTCKKCGCIISLKTTLNQEQCPIDKWKAVSIK